MSNYTNVLKILNSTELSVKDKCQKLGISKSSYYRLLKQYNITFSKKYLERDWLYDQYIMKNLSVKEIADLCSTTKTTICRKLKELNIKKEELIINQQRDERSYFKNPDFQQKRVASLIKKYGVSEPHQNAEVRKKYQKTMLDLYDTDSPLKNVEIKNKKDQTMLQRFKTKTPLKNKEVLERYRATIAEKYRIDLLQNNISDKIHIRTFENKTLKEIAEENNVGYTTITHFLRNKEDVKREDFNNFLKECQSNHSDIEHLFSNLCNFGHFNKKIISYRPDFKLNDYLYLNVDGLYWHSELKVEKDYHFKMREDFEKNNLNLIQIRSDEIKNHVKMEIVKSLVLNKTKCIYNKIGARKCQINQVDNSQANKFLNQHHLMGGIKAKHIGLFFKNELVSVLSYKYYKNVFKVERFCSKINYIINGAFGKLLNYLEKKYLPSIIHYWVDLRYGTGDFLINQGFKKERETLGWKWTDFKNTYNRLKCRANMDNRKLSEKQYAAELKWVKIYDAGQRLYVKGKNEI